MADEHTNTSQDEKRVVHAHVSEGPYIIAPDSAEPWPDEIWRRVDFGELSHSVEQIESMRNSAGAEELEENTSPRGFFIPKRDRDLLRRIGGVAATQALHRLREQ